MTLTPAAPQAVSSMPLHELTPFAGNPRRGRVALVAESLAALGQYRPIVVNRGTLTGRANEVLAGNHTLAAAQSLAWESIACTFVDVDDETAARIVLVDNRSNDVAEYDVASLVELLDELPDLAATGYAASDLDALRATLPTIDSTTLTPVDDDADDEQRATIDTQRERPYSNEQMIEALEEHYSRNGFPYPAMSRPMMLHAVNLLSQTSDERLVSTQVATAVANQFHPQRFAVAVRTKHTVLDTFSNDSKRAHAWTLIAESGSAPSDSFVRSTLAIVRGAQLAANFRPGYALHLLRKYAPDGGRWLDTSTGYGGRIVAFAASHMSEYVGIDPSSEQTSGNRSLVTTLALDERVKLVQQPAEDVDVETLGGAASFDFAFTSPPYFSRELYSPDEETQSHNRYRDGESWRDSFLAPTLALQYAALKSGCVAAVNIADVTIGTTDYPLVEWTIACAKAAGFEHESTELLPLSRVPGQGVRPDAYEPTLVFRKM